MCVLYVRVCLRFFVFFLLCVCMCMLVCVCARAPACVHAGCAACGMYDVCMWSCLCAITSVCVPHYTNDWCNSASTCSCRVCDVSRQHEIRRLIFNIYTCKYNKYMCKSYYCLEIALLNACRCILWKCAIYVVFVIICLSLYCSFLL